MTRFEHPNPDVATIVSRLSCGRCGTPVGGGLAATVDKIEPRKYGLRTRCLRCGIYAHAMLEVESLEPGEVDPRALRDADPISSDELLDIMTMPEPTFANAWAKLTGSTKPS